MRCSCAGARTHADEAADGPTSRCAHPIRSMDGRGFGCHATLEANEMVGRPVYLARTVMKLGGYFFIENSYYLRIWDLPFMLSRME